MALQTQVFDWAAKAGGLGVCSVSEKQDSVFKMCRAISTSLEPAIVFNKTLSSTVATLTQATLKYTVCHMRQPKIVLELENLGEAAPTAVVAAPLRQK